jgi:DNA topoisomerase-1
VVDANAAIMRTARALGLRRVSDREPGVQRRRSRGGFGYYYPDGRRVRSGAVIRRIRSTAVPPAYTNVWICNRPDGHIQATGRDAKGRKQYRYHPAWESARNSVKYDHMLAFGLALPRIRRRVASDLRLRGMPRKRVLAAMIRLLEVTLIRVGNDEYARKNGSYGLTTLCNHHVDVSGSSIRFDFRGKSGKLHRIEIDHPALAAIVKDCLELPGRELFQYLDESGKPCAVSSADVNAFLQECAGPDFSAKDYRTWAGSVLALAELRRRPCASEREARQNMVTAAKAVAERLGNTPAICRKSYIHPGLFEVYRTGSLPEGRGARCGRLRGDEAVFLRFLKQHKKARARAS